MQKPICKYGRAISTHSELTWQDPMSVKKKQELAAFTFNQLLIVATLCITSLQGMGLLHVSVFKMKQNVHLKVLFHLQEFSNRFKANLWEEDNLSTTDNWPVPNVSFVRRFYCSSSSMICSKTTASEHFLKKFRSVNVEFTPLKWLVRAHWVCPV